MEVHTISCLTNKLHDDVPDPPRERGGESVVDSLGIKVPELGISMLPADVLSAAHVY